MSPFFRADRPAVGVAWPALLLGALALCGCADPVKPAFAAEAGARPADAIPLFEAICAPSPASPRCVDARARATRLRLLRAAGATDDADLEVLKKDPALAPAVSAIQASPDRASALAFEAALKAGSVGATAEKMAEIEARPASAAPKAREWLARHRSAVLLETIKASCQPAGRGPCAEPGRELAEIAPGSEEAREAEPLVAARSLAALPLLRKCEAALGQRVVLYNRAAIQARCHELGGEWVGSEGACDPDGGQPNPSIPTPEFLQKYWDGLMGQLTDPSHVDLFQARWKRAAESGIVIPKSWPDPGKDPGKPARK
jgi:hypothetical protein